MEDAQIVEEVRKKRFLIDAFLYSASLPSGGEPEGTLKHAVTGHFLQAVVLELIIKTFYELDLKKRAPFTHDVEKLYQELPRESRAFLESAFDEARERRRKQFSGVEDVEFHPLQDVLRNNEMTVKNFKYDAMAVPSNSSADGDFYRAVLQHIKNKAEESNV